MWKNWLPNERYVTKLGGNLNRLKINILQMWPRRKYTQLCWQSKSTMLIFRMNLTGRIARKMAREGRDVNSVCNMTNEVGNVVSDADGMKDIWRKYMLKMSVMAMWIILE